MTQVVVTIDINRYQTVNNDGKTAKSPDYGIWYDQMDSFHTGMFEVTGRFYRMDEAIATHADVTVGNTTDGRSMVRTDSGAKKEKSDWSFTDKYYAWTSHYDYYRCGHYWTYEIFDYTAKHLQSSTRAYRQR